MVDREHAARRACSTTSRRFQYDNATVKVDWALDGPIPWTTPTRARAGTVHISEGVDALTEHAGELARGLIPGRPFLLFGQYSMVDPTRAPAGCETAWAYTHTPQRRRAATPARDGLTGSWDERETRAIFTERMETPGRGARAGLQVADPGSPRAHAADVRGARTSNLVNGALNGGTPQLHQQLIFRPIPGARPPGDADQGPLPRQCLRAPGRWRARRVRRQCRAGRAAPRALGARRR